MAVMTKQNLDRHLELQQKLESNRDLFAALEAAAGPRVQKLDGMPHAPSVSDPVGVLAAEIADMRETVAQLETEVACSAIEIADYIQGIPDSLTRMIFRLRFIHGMVWKEVAATVGGGNTENAVKNICYRYLKNGPARPVGRPPKNGGVSCEKTDI